MNWKNNSERYASVSIGLHWLMLWLIAAVYACIELRGLIPKGNDLRDTLKAWHFMLGLSVFVLVIFVCSRALSAVQRQLSSRLRHDGRNCSLK